MVMEPFVRIIYKQLGAFHNKHAHMMTIREGQSPCDGFTKPSYKDLDLGELMSFSFWNGHGILNFFHDNRIC